MVVPAEIKDEIITASLAVNLIGWLSGSGGETLNLIVSGFCWAGSGRGRCLCGGEVERPRALAPDCKPSAPTMDLCEFVGGCVVFFIRGLTLVWALWNAPKMMVGNCQGRCKLVLGWVLVWGWQIQQVRW